MKSWSVTNKVLVVLLLVLGGVAMARFVVPGKTERQRAVGSLNGLDDEMRRAFMESDDFATIPDPGPGDWLSAHKENGQTYAQYLRSRPNMPRGARRKLYIQPIGKFDDATAPSLSELRAYTEAYYYPMKVVVLPSLTPNRITNRVNGGKRQLLTKDLLDWLQRHLPADAYSMLGITMTDLYPDPSWNFVFGQARLRARVGVFSFARYHPSFYGNEAEGGEATRKLVLKRAAKVLTHETGHMFGVRHCVHYHCNMNGANNLTEADASPMVLCPVCLRKMHTAIRFDPISRYRKLLVFFKKHGFENEAAWVQDRIRFIKKN